MPDRRLPRLRLPHGRGARERRPRPGSQLSDEQVLILGLLLIVLLAVSMLYCLGFASLALREAWQRAPAPWNGTAPAAEPLDSTATAAPETGTLPP